MVEREGRGEEEGAGVVDFGFILDIQYFPAYFPGLAFRDFSEWSLLLHPIFHLDTCLRLKFMCLDGPILVLPLIFFLLEQFS